MRRLECLAFLLVMLAGRAVPAEPAPEFRAGKPVWPKGRKTEMNLLVGFRAVVPAPPAGAKVVLRVAASTLYRACVNGELRRPRAGARAARVLPRGRVGPDRRARAGRQRGRHRGGRLQRQQLLPARPAVVPPGGGGRGRPGAGGNRRRGTAFEAAILDQRVQKVQRYSFQRPFIEVYRLAPGFDRWRREAAAPFAAGRDRRGRAQARCCRAACRFPTSPSRARPRTWRRGAVETAACGRTTSGRTAR